MEKVKQEDRQEKEEDVDQEHDVEEEENTGWRLEWRYEGKLCFIIIANTQGRIPSTEGRIHKHCYGGMDIYSLDSKQTFVNVTGAVFTIYDFKD